LRRKRNSILKNSLFLGTAQAAEGILAFALVVILARYLGKVNYGRYAFAFAFASLFSFLTDFGLSQILIREIAKDRSHLRDYFPSSLILQIILSLVGFFFISLGINIMGYPPTTVKVVYIAGLFIVFNGMTNCWRALFIAYEKMEYEALLAVIGKVVPLLGALIFIYFDRGLLTLASVPLWGAIAGLFLSTHLVFKKFIPVKLNWKINYSLLRKLLAMAFPFALLTIFVMIYFQIDSVMLSIFKGDAAVGVYNVAYKLVFALMFVSTGISAAIFPVISRIYVNQRKAALKVYGSSFKNLLALGLPLALGGAIFAPRIISLLYGSAYQESVLILQVIIWVLPFMFLTNLMGRVLGAINQQSLVAWIAGIGAVINVTLNLILIPTYSFVGAAIATIITEAVILVFQYHFIGKYLGRVPLFSSLAKIIPANLFLAIGAFYLRGLGLTLSISLAGTGYFVILYLTKFFLPEELESLKGLILGKS